MSSLAGTCARELEVLVSFVFDLGFFPFSVIFLAVMGTVNPGDEVLVPDPSWPHYYHCIALAGGCTVSVPLREIYVRIGKLGTLYARDKVYSHHGGADPT
jgi:Aminotransferase class I and II